MSYTPHPDDDWYDEWLDYKIGQGDHQSLIEAHHEQQGDTSERTDQDPE